MIDQQTASQLGRIITLKLQGRTIAEIARQMRLPKRQVDFLLWKHLRKKALPRMPMRQVLIAEQRWQSVYDCGAMGVRAVKETA